MRSASNRPDFFSFVALAVILLLPAADASAQPAFSKAFSPTSMVPGARSTLTFTITESSGSAATDVAFTDVFPSGLVIASPANLSTTCDLFGNRGNAGSLTGSVGSDTVTLTGATLAPSQSCTITVDVTSNAAGTYNNTSGDLTSSQGNSGSASATLTVNSVPVPTMSKAFSPTTIAVGGTSTVTVTIDNSGNGSSLGFFAATFSDTFPSGMVVAADPNFSNTCPTGAQPNAGATSYTYQNFGTIGAGTTCAVSWDVTVSAAGDYINTATGSGSLTGVSAEAVLSVPASTAFLSKSFGASAVPGGTVTLSFTIDNNAAGDATNIAFTDDLDAALSGLVATGLPASNICGSGSTLTGTSTLSLTGGSLQTGQSCTFDVTLSVPGGAAPGTYTNTTSTASATVTVDAGGRTPSSSGETFAAASANLQVVGGINIDAEFTDDPVLPGGTATVEFTLTNTDGATTATGVAFTMNLTPHLPDGTTFTQTVNTCGGTSTTTGGGFSDRAISYFGGSIAAGASCTIAGTVPLPGGASPGTFTFTTSTVTSNLPTSPSDSAQLIITAIPTFSKAFSASAVPGGAVDLEFTLSNTEGTSAVSAISFTDDLDAVLSGLVATALPASGFCGAGSTISGTSTLSVTGASLAAGGECTFSVSLLVPAGASSGTYTNTTSSAPATIDGNPVTLPVATADLAVVALRLTKSFTDDPTFPGGTLALQYTLQNFGATDATSITFEDDFNPVISGLQSTSGSQSVCGGTAAGTTTLSFSGGALTAGNTCSFTVSLSVPATATPAVYSSGTRDFEASFGGPATTLTNAGDSFEIESPISITKEFTSDPVAPGGTGTLQFTITNAGTSTVTALTFTDDLDAALTGLVATGLPASNVCGAGSTLSGTSTVTLSGGNVAAASSCTFSLTFLVPSNASAGSTANNETGTLQGTYGGVTVTGGTATDALQISAVVPAFSKAFSPINTTVGAPSRLVLTIDNAQNAVSATSLAFTDNLPSGMTVASTPNASTTCPVGTVTAVAGSSAVSFSGGTVGAGQTCDVAADVVVSTIGSYTNTTGDLTSSLGNSGTASASLSANGPPVFTKAFSPANILQEGTSTLTFTINNSGSTASASNLAFDDTFPSGLVVADPSNLTSSCSAGSLGGFLNASSGGGGLILSAASIQAGATCTISVDVTSETGGDYTNTTGSITSSQGTGGAATASINVSAPPVFSKAFSANPTVVNVVSTLTLTINNAPNGLAASSLSFTDTLPSGLVVANPSNAATTCTGGTLTAASGTSAITYSGGTVAAASSCAISVDVVAASAGDYVNTSGSLTSSSGDSGTTSATLRVNALPVFTKAFGTNPALLGNEIRLTFTINNSGSTSAASALAFSDTFPAGMTLSPTPDAATTCTGGTTTATANAGSVSYSAGSAAAGATCTLSVDVLTSSVGDFNNTSGALTSSLGNSGTASASVRVNAPPAFSKSFGTDPTTIGTANTLTFTIDNSGSSIAATSLDFTDNLPSGLVIATVPNAATTCTGGTFSAAAGSGTISYSGGTVAAGATCTLSVDVVASAAGNYTNTSGSLTSNLGSSGTASATVRVNPAPTFSKSFGTDPAVAGTAVTLTFTIDNTASTVDATSLAFADNLPSGVVIAGTPNASATCASGTTTAAAGSGTISYAGGTVSAGATCAVSVDVVASAAGTYTNTSGDLTSNLGNSGTASDSFRVNGPPAFSKAFASSPVLNNTPVALTFTISNTGSTVSATSLAFTDNLPSGLVVASTPNASTTCTGGTTTAVAGGSAISYSGGSVGAGASCTVSADVVAAAFGDYTNVSGALTSSLGTSGTATATLRVNGAPQFSKTFSPNPGLAGTPSTLTFTISNVGSSTAATSLAFTDNLPSGLVLAATPNAATTCTGGTLTASAGAGVISYSGGTVGATSSCTVQADVVGSTFGSYANTSGDLTSSLGNSGSASATLVLNVPPNFSKVFLPNPGTTASPSTLTFTINNGTSTVSATSLAFTDNLPTGLSVAATPNAATTCTGGTLSAVAGASAVSYSGGTVAPGATCTLSVDVQASVAGDFTNISGSLTSSLGDSGTSSAALRVNPPPTFSKAFATNPTLVDTAVRLTFTIDNSGSTAAATGLGFSDNLPTGLLVASPPNAAANCSGGALSAAAGTGAIDYSAGSVAAGATCTVAVDVSAANPGEYANVSGNLTSSLGNSGSAGATLRVNGESGFAKAFSPSSIQVGEVSTLTFTIDNTASSVTATGVTFSDTFPLGMTVATTPNAGSTCSGGTLTASAGAGAITYSGGTVPASSTCTVSVDVSVNAVGVFDNISSDLTNSLGTSAAATATLTASSLDFGDAPSSYGTLLADDGARHVLGSAGNNVFLGTAPSPESDGKPDAGAALDGDDGVTFSTLTAGEAATATITVGASGSASVGSALLNAWIDFDGNGSFDGADQIASDVSFATAGTHQLAFTVPASATGGATYARFRYASSSTGATGQAADGEVEDYAVSVGATADLAVTLTGDGAAVAGTSASYVVTVSNAGPTAASGVTAVLVLGTGLSVAGSDCAVDETTATWSVGTVASGASVECAVTLSVAGDASGSASVSVSVSSGVGDDDETNNTASVDVAVTQSADLAITKTSSGTAVAGSSVTFEIVVSNNGPSTASIVGITESPQTGLTFVSASGPCASSGFPCSAGSLASGASLTITAIFQVAADASGNLTNTASAFSPEPDPVTTNNSASATVSTGTSADVAITKTGPTALIPGAPATYVLTATNAGPSEATGVVVTDVLPAGLELVEVAGACTVLPCEVGTLAVGASAEITLTVDVATSLSGDAITNTGSVTASTPDPNDDNNSASVTSGVLATADLELTKSADILASGTATTNSVRYVVTVTNFGPSNALGIEVTDDLPGDFTVVSSTQTQGTFVPSSGLWNIGALGVGHAASLEYVVETTSSGDFENLAQVTASGVHDADSSPGNAVEEEDDQQTVSVTLRPVLGSGSGQPVTNPLGGTVAFFAQGPGSGGSTAASKSESAPGDVFLYAGSLSSGVFRLVEQSDGTRVWELVSPSVSASVLQTTALASESAGGSGRLVVSLRGPVAGSGGVFESLDRGLSWARLPGTLDPSRIQVLAVIGGSVLAGTADAGVMRQTGSGWSTLAPGLEGRNVRAIATSNGTTYAGTWASGAFRLDAGAWQSVSTGLSVSQVTSLVDSPQWGLIAGTWGGGVFRLDGESWTPLGTGIDRGYVRGIVGAGAGGLVAVARGGVYEFDPDSGAWDLLESGLTAEEVVSAGVVIGADGQPSSLYGGTSGDWIYSIDDASGSGDFSSAGPWSQAPAQRRDLTVRDLSFDNRGGLFAAVDGAGILYAPSELTGFDLLNNGLETRAMRALETVALDAGAERLVAGSASGIYLLDDGDASGALDSGDTWKLAAGSEGLQVQATTQSGGRLIAATPTGVRISVDGGLSWQAGGLAGVDVRSLAALPSGGNLFAGTVLDGVQRSTDGGMTWTDTAGGVGGPVSALAALGTNVFAGTPQGVYVSSDLGTTWSLMSFEFLATDVISLTAIEPGVVYAGANYGGAFYLTDQDRDGAFGDETWMALPSIDAEHYIGAAAVSEVTRDAYFGSTEGRIFRIAQPAGVGVADGSEIPDEFGLGQNYPNPFNPVTTIPFAMARSGNVSVTVFDVMGREVARLISGVKNAGYHVVLWDAAEVPSGVYLYRIQAEGYSEVRQLVLLK